MTADRIPAFHKLAQLADSLKPGSLRARFAALSAPQRTMVILIAVLLAIVLATYNRYGFTFDEFKGFGRAKWVLRFLSGNTEENVSGVDMFHGAAPDVLALVLQKLLPPLSYDSRHLVFALFGVAGIYYVYRFGSKFVGEWIGVFAALFLAITPMWFGYMFINHKDIPFATLLFASSYYCLLALTEPATPRGLWLKVGLAVGLLATTKLAGLLVLAYIVAVYLGCLAIFGGQNKLQVARDLGRRVASVGLAGLLGCLFSFVLFWPQFYFFDIVFRDMSQHSVFAPRQDPFYASMYFVISTPLFLVALGVIGIGCAIYRREAAIIAGIVIFFSLLAAQALLGVRVYNGFRHFLFLYPFFAMTAAYPVALMFDAAKGGLARLALTGAIAVCVAGTIFEMYRLFPYQYSFYNSLVGGFAGADGVFEIDTWRSAHREALDLIASRVRPGETVRIRSCASKLDLKIHPGFELAQSNEEADYFVALRRGKKCAPEVFDGLPVVGEVRREGVLLARVYAARERSAPTVDRAPYQ